MYIYRYLNDHLIAYTWTFIPNIPIFQLLLLQYYINIKCLNLTLIYVKGWRINNLCTMYWSRAYQERKQ